MRPRPIAPAGERLYRTNRSFHNPKVGGSNPLPATNHAFVKGRRMQFLLSRDPACAIVTASAGRNVEGRTRSRPDSDSVRPIGARPPLSFLRRPAPSDECCQVRPNERRSRRLPPPNTPLLRAMTLRRGYSLAPEGCAAWRQLGP
jgi:hypothetical protein